MITCRVIFEFGDQLALHDLENQKRYTCAKELLLIARQGVFPEPGEVIQLFGEVLNQTNKMQCVYGYKFIAHPMFTAAGA